MSDVLAINAKPMQGPRRLWRCVVRNDHGARCHFRGDHSGEHSAFGRRWGWA